MGKKAIKLIIKGALKPPRNPLHFALLSMKPGSHEKTEKALRRLEKIKLQQALLSRDSDNEPQQIIGNNPKGRRPK